MGGVKPMNLAAGFIGAPIELTGVPAKDSESSPRAARGARPGVCLAPRADPDWTPGVTESLEFGWNSTLSGVWLGYDSTGIRLEFGSTEIEATSLGLGWGRSDGPPAPG